ncbi:MAG: PAS domain S-box protein, partial [Microcystaceae cyanobacterium]
LLQRLSVKLAIAIQQFLANQQIKTQLIEMSESENRFRQLAENIHQVFYLVDVETSEMLYISPSYETVWERDCQSLYDNPLSYQEIICFEDREIVRQSYQGARLGNATQAEYRIVRSDGSLRWISDRNFPVRNEKGEIYRVCGIAEDITNRKQVELQLAAREAQFQKLAATLPGMLYTLVRKVDGSFVFTYISPIITEIMELEAEAAIADSNLAFELIHPDDLPNYTAAVEQSLITMRPFDHELRIITPSGQTKWLKISSRPEKMPNQEIHCFGVCLDITEQKEAQIQLGKTETLFREAQRIAHLGNWELNLFNNYLYWSEEIFHIFEIDSQQFTPSYEGFLAAIHPEDQDLVNDAYTQHLRDQLPYYVIHRLLMADGRVKYVQEQCETIFADDATPLFSQGTIQDITEIKQAELLLQNINQSLEITIEERTRELSEINILQQTILDGTDLGIISTNFEGIIQTFNRGAEKMLGYSAEEIVGKETPDLFLTTEDLQQIASNFSAKLGLEVEGNVRDINLKTQAVIKEQEVTYVRKDGSCLPVQLSVNPLKNDQQEIIAFLGISRDITIQKESDRQRQEAEEALRKSEMRFRRVFESDVVGMMFCNFDGEILEANNRFLEMIGYSRDELEKGLMNWEEMTPSEYRQLDLDAIDHLKQYSFIKPWEKVYTHKDGHPVYVLVGVALLTDSEDRCVCVVIDISDRKLSEKNLEVSRSKFQRLVDDMGDKFVVFSHNGFEGIVNYVSGGVDAVFGISKQEAIGQNWATAINWLPEDISGVTQKIMAMAQGKIDFYQNEMRFIHPDGGIRTIQVSHHPIKNQAGKLIAIEGIVEDITERKQREQENYLLKERLEFLLSANPAVIFTCQPKEDFGATFVSNNIYRITGYTVSEFLSKSSFWADHLHPEDAPLIFANLNNLFEQGYHLHEYRFQHRDGHYLWVSNELSLVKDEQGNPLEIVGYFADISERKNQEIELRNAYEELAKLLKLREETLTMREDMSNMIVHDLRNPLTGILLGANIAQQYLTHGYSTEKIINKLEQITSSGKQMQKMIDSLLLMAKLESGKFLLNPTLTDLSALGTKIINDFELMATNRQVELRSTLPPLGNSINIDATILRRIIENLITNALKFSPPQSQVMLILEYLPDDHLRIQVTDHGPGINEEQKQRIFEKFEIGEFQRNASQIGLGLAFCKMAVDAQGGTLAIAPNQPNGSIFIVEI